MVISVSKNAFSVVELIVAISVIAIISSIAFGSFGGARATARDNERLNNLKNLQLAIELYKAENGVYPAGGCDMHRDGDLSAWVAPGPFTTGASYGDGTSGTESNCADYIEGLVPDFIAALPVDPRTAEQIGYRYAVNQARTEYKLLAHASVESSDVSLDDELHRCRSGCTFGFCSSISNYDDPGYVRTYAVYSPGAACW